MRTTLPTNQKIYRLGAAAGIFAGVSLITLMALVMFAPIGVVAAVDSGSSSLSMAYTAEQNLSISLDKTNVGITAASTDFDKMLTNNFNVTVSTNNSTGYVLNMAVDSFATNGATITSGGSTQENVATNALVNTENNKYYLPSIAGSITNPTDSTFPTNSWAYSISDPSASPVDMVYSPLPAAGSSEEIKKVTSLTLEEDSDGNLTADDVTPVTVATKADMSIPAGAYTNKLVFTAITNFNPEYDTYTIIYNSNGGSGTIDNQYAVPGEAVTLVSNTFTRTGYTFLGWSTNQNAAYATYTDKQTIDNGLSNIIGAEVTLYAIWVQNAAAKTIVYNANGADGGDMSMVTHTGISNSATVELYAQNYWRKGYGFLGWSTDPAAESKIGTSSPATIYGPNETITASSTMSTQGMILFAVWKKSEGNMQDWKGCSSMSIGDVTALTDTRDNDTYAVAKLADQKCWSVENLRLSSGAVNSSDTHNPISNFAWTTSTNSFCTAASSACNDKVVVNTNNINSNLTASPSAQNNSSSWYSYGVMYNWHTATAGNGTYSTSGSNVAGDICPLSWHLPTGASGGEFQTIYTAVGNTSANIRKYPNNFIYSGLWRGGSAELRGPKANGFYWSATAANNNAANRLYITSGNIDSAYYSKAAGFAVRCIAE